MPETHVRRVGEGQYMGPEAAYVRRAARGIRKGPRKEDLLAKYILKLYITGSSPRAEVAIGNLRRICEEDLSGEYVLEIIDVQQNPEIAETDRILATPTLVKQLPPPLRRVIGDLSDRDKVLLGLELRQQVPPNPTRAKPV